MEKEKIDTSVVLPARNLPASLASSLIWERKDDFVAQFGMQWSIS